ncbi:hypothetical protein H4R18_001524 [Coemansia javaensis]|uniref:NADH-ubiquinone oxidoreductase 14 kDa subunit n=1 Tax=Coemansia javaensis TaxID=2761396 RepID=A0A9W8HGY9_9FUNG|nr:hypothetical protein H4R18_001524 [Coemansia javaensis]
MAETTAARGENRAPSTRSPFLSIAVGVGIGMFTGMYSMGLQKRPVLRPHFSYGIYSAVGAFLGYQVFSIRERRRGRILERRDMLLEKRARRHAENAKHAAESD